MFSSAYFDSSTAPATSAPFQVAGILLGFALVSCVVLTVDAKSASKVEMITPFVSAVAAVNGKPNSRLSSIEGLLRFTEPTNSP